MFLMNKDKLVRNLAELKIVYTGITEDESVQTS